MDSGYAIKNKGTTLKTYAGQDIAAATNYVIQKEELVAFRADETLSDDLLNNSDIVMAQNNNLTYEYDGQIGVDFLMNDVRKIIIPGNGGPIDIDYVDWTTVASFMLPATSQGVLTRMQVDCDNGDAEDIDIRLYDVTNANVVVKKLNIVQTRGAIEIDRTNSDELDTGNAIFDVQCKRSGGTGTAHYYSTMLTLQ